MNLQPLPQPELAAWIDAEKLPAEQWISIQGSPMQWFPVSFPASVAVKFSEIRLAPGALNDYYLPKGVEPHNPDSLTPEQITEGGLYRAVMLEECDGRHEEVCEVWIPSSDKFLLAGAGCHTGYTYRVSITTPLPAVKESLAPQSATGQSKTPESDSQKTWAWDTRFGELDVIPLEAAQKIERERDAALAERDEARRLLGEASVTLHGIANAKPQEWDDPNDFKAWAQSRARHTDTQITNHLKTA